MLGTCHDLALPLSPLSHTGRLGGARGQGEGAGADSMLCSARDLGLASTGEGWEGTWPGSPPPQSWASPEKPHLWTHLLHPPPSPWCPHLVSVPLSSAPGGFRNTLLSLRTPRLPVAEENTPNSSLAGALGVGQPQGLCVAVPSPCSEFSDAFPPPPPSPVSLCPDALPSRPLARSRSCSWSHKSPGLGGCFLLWPRCGPRPHHSRHTGGKG